MKLAGTLEGSGKIETSNLTVQPGGRLIVSKFLEVTGNLVVTKGSEVMLGLRRPTLPKPPGLEKGLYDLTDYYQSEAAVKLYSQYYDVSLDAAKSSISDFMRTDHAIYEPDSKGILTVTTRYGITGGDLIAIGIRVSIRRRPPPPPPPPPTKEFDFPLMAPKIMFESGSSLNFTIEDGYAPSIGDMISVANVPMQIGENVHTNLAPGWVITNSAATAQYVGLSIS